jgi:hypothetical protein
MQMRDILPNRATPDPEKSVAELEFMPHLRPHLSLVEASHKLIA